jgi:EAL domain-containing protein (putative c-di-GMP-specific phosphodiesterase class I)
MRRLVEMSKTMGTKIIMEGIETQNQLDLVRTVGIAQTQLTIF